MLLCEVSLRYEARVGNPEKGKSILDSHFRGNDRKNNGESVFVPPASAFPVKIALQNISKTFGGLKAVDAVSFEAGDGECFFLLGPSGGNREYKSRANHWNRFSMI